MCDFIHLHVHSHYSILESTATVGGLVGAAGQNGMTALGLTDLGNMFGAIEFYSKCRDAGIKPIVGYEALMSSGSRRQDDDLGFSEPPYHLTLLCKNQEGYLNLMKLASSASLDADSLQPSTDKAILARHSKGLIGLSGCLASESSFLLSKGRVHDALDVIDKYRNIFEPGQFFLEIQESGVPEQDTVNEQLLKISKDIGLPLVATADVHYLVPQDFDAYHALLCMGTGKSKEDAKVRRRAERASYFKSPAEMQRQFRHVPEAIANTKRVEEMVELELDVGSCHHPIFKSPNGIPPEQYLRQRAEEGLYQRYREITPEIRNRFEYELKVIGQMEFSNYILIVWDLVRYARGRGIPVGPGRGAVGGSLVCYCLGMTALCPLKHGLIFERFINPARNEMPDIDLDFDMAWRREMLEHVTRKYGPECVSRIITFNTFGAKTSLWDVGRLLDVPLSEIDKLAKKIPEVPGVTLDSALEDKEFSDLVNSNLRYTDVVDTARRLEGLVHSTGIHAAGVVIADRNILNYCPLLRSPGTSVTTTQFSVRVAEQIGLLKLDFLGLSSLTLVRLVVNAIREGHGIEIDPEDLPLDDKKTYEMLSQGETKGVFQFESDGMKQLLIAVKPNCFEDLVALNAMYRPGRTECTDLFVARKCGREPTYYFHPSLEPILRSTYGIIVYDEQVIAIAYQVAGFDVPTADLLREAIDKNHRELMKYRQPFIDGAVQNDFTVKQAGNLWDQLVALAGYGVNKSHTAAYVFLACQTAWLKAHYPTEFMAAQVTMDSGEPIEGAR